jgi:hypothetical protein
MKAGLDQLQLPAVSNWPITTFKLKKMQFTDYYYYLH